MKRTIFLIVLILFGFLINAQETHFNFKGLLSDNNGGPLSNATINVKVTIKYHQTIPFDITNVLWEEEHTNVHTDDYGIFSIEMGDGNKIGGSATFFQDINWITTPFLDYRYDIDIDMGTGYQNFVADEVFKSVPFSNFANKAATALKLEVQDSYIRFSNDITTGLCFDIGNEYFYLTNRSQGFGFYYGNGMALKLNDSTGVEIPGYLIVGEKLRGIHSGDADMKAYIYGYFDGQGNIFQDACSSGFTVSKISTGRYRISFSNSPGGDDRYIAFAISQGSYFNVSTTQFDSYFEIYVRNIDTNSYADPPNIKFVVFKK